MQMIKRIISMLCLLLTASALLILPAAGEQEADGSVEATQAEATPEPVVEPMETSAPTEVPGPSVRFTRDFSSGFAEYGDKVTISYTVRNDSALPLENVVVKDGLVGEIGRADRIEAGDRKTFSVRVRVTETCTSYPGISYEYAGAEYTEECSSGKISLAEVRLTVELSADKTNVAPGEMVTLRLKVANEGNVNLYGLRAEEPMLGDLGSLVASLPPGDECLITRTVQMKGTGTFQFSITGSSDTGSAISVQSNEMSVLVTPVAAQIQLSLQAKADRTELSAPGAVVFSIYVNNECSLELRNVLLSEETRGKIRDLVFVPTGEMPVITETYEIEESGIFRFQAQVVDSVGDRLTVYSEPIEIVLTGEKSQTSETDAAPEQTVGPEESSIPVLDGVPYRMEEKPATFERLMLGTSLTMFAVLWIWNTVAGIRKRSERRRKARRRKQKKSKQANAKK